MGSGGASVSASVSAGIAELRRITTMASANAASSSTITAMIHNGKLDSLKSATALNIDTLGERDVPAQPSIRKHHICVVFAYVARHADDDVCAQRTLEEVQADRQLDVPNEVTRGTGSGGDRDLLVLERNVEGVERELTGRVTTSASSSSSVAKLWDVPQTSSRPQLATGSNPAGRPRPE